jgi:Protein of unknown function (DUF3300)
MVMMAVRALATVLLLAISHAAIAQTQEATAQSDQLVKPEQLDALIAPIALYPDTLLAEVLMASTYPLEVVEAERWVKANKNLSGADLKAAVDKQKWDDSLKSLAATPSVLEMMSSKLEWTQQLGNAVLAQQADVMDAIQRLRTKAQANNKLNSTKEQTVSTQEQGGKQVIVIEPTQPDTVYVPYYDPAVVYGPWPYPAYPPYYFGWPGYIGAGVIATGLAFGAGYALGRWVSGGLRWGGGCNWGSNNININRPVNINNINIGNKSWTHNPVHRQGVRYANANVAQKFGGGRNNVAGGGQNRLDFRGRGGNQVLQPGAGGNRPNLGGGASGNRPGVGNLPSGGNRPGGGDRPGAGNRPGGGDRPSAGNRPRGGDRPSAGNRPAGGDRPSAGNRPSNRPTAGTRPSGGRTGGNALGNVSSGRVANLEAGRGRASLSGGGGGVSRGGGGAVRMGGGGGGFRGGGGRGGGGRRSDARLKHDITLIGHFDNGIGFYRFAYNGSDKVYVGVMAQEVQAVRPDAVRRGRDGYLRVFYDRLGLKFETYDAWVAAGACMPATLAH